MVIMCNPNFFPKLPPASYNLIRRASYILSNYR